MKSVITKREELCKRLEELQFEIDRVALEIVHTPTETQKETDTND